MSANVSVNDATWLSCNAGDLPRSIGRQQCNCWKCWEDCWGTCILAALPNWQSRATLPVAICWRWDAWGASALFGHTAV